MARPLTLDPDRLLPADPATCAIAHASYADEPALDLTSRRVRKAYRIDDPLPA
jgi:hypothetical protein